MKPKISFELWRWLYFLLFWLITMTLVVIISQVVAVPFMQWLFHSAPYTFPGWYSLGRWCLWALLMSFFAGTVTWYYEKRSSGR